MIQRRLLSVPRGSLRILLLLGMAGLPLQLTGSTARAQTAPGILTERVQIFLPGEYVPLSPFLKGPNIVLSLPVKPEILSFILSSPSIIRVAHWNPDTKAMQLLLPSDVNAASGVVQVMALYPGLYTVVSDAFRNDFPVVTHWDQSLNNGRGGHRLGASDAFSGMDIDPLQGVPTGSFLGSLAEDKRSESPYRWRADQYGLFSGDSLNPDARVPGFERYVAENYTLVRPTELLAIWLSDQALRSTGYPILYRNHPWAFDPTAPAAKQAQQGVPLLQVVNSYVAATAPDKGSLATFILPPHWRPAPTSPPAGYPVIFNGWYDNNQTLFSGHGLPFLKMIGESFSRGEGSLVAILWNGGGAYGGTRTFHRSAYDNAALLFRNAQGLLGIDPHRVVTFGYSRGGVTAILMAANPYHESYTVRYALAYGAPIKIGEWSNFLNFSFPAFDLLSADVGYKYAWRQGWRDPETDWTAQKKLLFNWFGTWDAARIDAELSGFSDAHVGALKRKGTKVHFLLGTHDVNFPYSIGLEFVEKLRRFGVPTRLETYYRMGHSGSSRDPYNDLRTILRELLVGIPAFQEGNFHYRKVDEEEWFQYAEFSPSHQPVLLEAPKAAVLNSTVSFVLVGGEGMHYQLQTWRISEEAWNQSQRIEKISEAACLGMKSVFIGNSSSPLTPRWIVRHLPLTPACAPAGLYLYELFYSLDGATWFQVPPYSVPYRPERQPTFQILAEEPPGPIDGEEVTKALTRGSGRAWGLSGEFPSSHTVSFLLSISPSAGPVGARVTLTGTGFTATGNTLHFGTGAIPGLPSQDGRTIAFEVPSALTPLCVYSTPPCLAPSQLLLPGIYPVWVSNAHGESINKLSFAVTPETPVTPAEPQVVTTPAISSLVPSSGPVGAQVTILGAGFTPTDNRVNFAGVQNAVTKLSSPDGKTLVFTVPATPCDLFKGAPCTQQVLAPGDYPVSVTNANGSSNIVIFKLTDDSELLAAVKAGKSLLFVAPHPDDEGMIGSLLARACRDYGNRCTLLCLTKGEKGCQPGGPCGEELKAIRTKEFLQFASTMGAKPIIADFGDLASGSPEEVIHGWNAKGDVKGFIRSVIQQENPDLLITLEPTHGIYGHPAHRAAGMLVTQIAQEQSSSTATLYYAINRYASIFGENLDPLPVTDIIDGTEFSIKLSTSYWDYFLEATKIYASQKIYEGVVQVTEKVTFARKVVLDIAETGFVNGLLRSTSAVVGPSGGTVGDIQATGAQVSILPGTISSSQTVAVSTVATSSFQDSQAVSLGLSPASPPVDIHIVGQETGSQFPQLVTITLSYDATQVSNPNLLTVQWWDEPAATWRPVPQVQVDPSAHTVTARVNHFTLFRVFEVAPQAAFSGNLGEVFAFPNPATSGKVTIHVEAGQADQVEIRIYDVAGALVHRAAISGPPGIGVNGREAFEYAWNVSGAASGIYLYAVRAVKGDQSATTVRKLAVVR